MIGIIDVGGGLRGVYGAGVFDRCLDDELSFDVCIGVSAGSANLTSFIAKQRGRNYPFYVDYPFRKEYMSFSNLLNGKPFLNLDYIYGTLSNEGTDSSLDYDVFKSYKGKFVVVSTDGNTGKTVYFDGMSMEKNDYRYLIASSTLPVFCKPCDVDGITCFDGGISDPIPVEKAFELGCDKVIVVLTRPLALRFDSGFDKKGSILIRHKFPEVSHLLDNRIKKYNEQIELIIKYSLEGKCIIIAPDDCMGVETLTKDKEKLRLLYEKGYRDGGKITEFMKKETVK